MFQIALSPRIFRGAQRSLTSLRSSQLSIAPVSPFVRGSHPGRSSWRAFSSTHPTNQSLRRDNDNKSDNKDKKKESVGNKLKILWDKYGVIAVGTYMCIYASTLTSVYLALDFDIFNAATFGMDAPSAVQKVCDMVESTTGNTSLPGYIRENPQVGTFVLAWAMTKITEPLRLAVTIGIVPKVAEVLGHRREEREEKERAREEKRKE